MRSSAPTACKYCGASIIFRSVIPSGKLMPLNVAPDPAGNVVLIGYHQCRVVTKSKPAAPGEPAYKSHFWDCNQELNRRGFATPINPPAESRVPDPDEGPPAAAPEIWSTLRAEASLEQLRLWQHSRQRKDEPRMADAAFAVFRHLDAVALQRLRSQLGAAWGHARDEEGRCLRAVNAALAKIERNHRDQIARDARAIETRRQERLL